jgi:hypothetical protein
MMVPSTTAIGEPSAGQDLRAYHYTWEERWGNDDPRDACFNCGFRRWEHQSTRCIGYPTRFTETRTIVESDSCYVRAVIWTSTGT